jgi:electron transport complex protein RnfC
MPYTFRGGIHPDDRKAATAPKPIELLPAPDQVILPVRMHIGAPCTPLVKPGERVLLGQKIADSDAFVSAPIHATVSGTVAAVEPRTHPDGTQVMSVVIDTDYLDEAAPTVQPVDSDTLTPEEIIRHIREAGIVGHGGAAFPTHVKLQSALGKIDHILLNGSECEPYLTSDHRLMLEYPWEIMGGVKILLRAFGVKNIRIGVESNKKDVFPALKEYLPPDDSVKVTPLATKYPQGSEKQLIQAILGREVPSGKLPADAGCMVMNIDTVAAIYRLFATGMPMIRRIVTVSGGATSNPKNLECRIGTPIEDLLEFCGGVTAPPERLIMGGPMMGVPLYTTAVPVIKGTNGILALTRKEVVSSRNPACIRCGKCLDACPMGLMPTYIYAAAQKGTPELLEQYHALDCMECGSCTWVCPGKVPLVQGFRTGKARLQAAKKRD